jgi:protein-tyrosine phosphatase
MGTGTAGGGGGGGRGPADGARPAVRLHRQHLPLADRLGADVAELPRRGYVVLSAGLSAAPGGPAAAEAVATLHGLGADLTDHASQPLTPRLLQQADHVFAMTSGHLRALHGHCPAAATVDLLSPDGDDIADPIGGDAEVYQRCAGQILQSLEARLGALLAG